MCWLVSCREMCTALVSLLESFPHPSALVKTLDLMNFEVTHSRVAGNHVGG
jgi:hypothetical protein